MHRRRYRIVVGVDLSEYSELVLEHALDQAARHEAPDLHFLTVREKRRPDAEDVKQELWERTYPLLETFNRHARDWRARLHIRRGKPAQQISQLAEEIRANLIVIGGFGLHHRRGDKNLPNWILQHAVCPTLVVGMPEEMQQSPMCHECAAIREDTDGDRWFCDDHAGRDRSEHVMTPMTTWTGGSLMW